jgi:hypothetical protein
MGRKKKIKHNPQNLSDQQDADFATVRGAAALAKLPAAERADWAALWADVAALEQKAAK